MRYQQLKRHLSNGTKESERMCASPSSFVRHKGNRCAFPLEYKRRRLSDNRSLVDPPIVTLGDGLKMNITRWSLLIQFSLEVAIPDDR
ncbi:hypothetical protein AVEN_208008-1 [Araneus ventricosus]|uniref:Uncharacterized protein n=1 Tax=Araneus ventricosus TaxID=182803 RepID=A0A4Y2BNB1_ARAVE|nr:hypothetical protein AVEN_208008-1 [Araneus ventricosus]